MVTRTPLCINASIKRPRIDFIAVDDWPIDTDGGILKLAGNASRIRLQICLRSIGSLVLREFAAVTFCRYSNIVFRRPHLIFTIRSWRDPANYVKRRLITPPCSLISRMKVRTLSFLYTKLGKNRKTSVPKIHVRDTIRQAGFRSKVRIGQG